jgi:hypothetical protein
MINLRELRFWTVLMTVSLCLYTILSALPTLRYGLAGLSVDAVSATARLAPFTDEPGVGALAKRDVLTLAPPQAAASRVAALASLIRDTPMSSGAWLDLSIAKEEAGAPMEQIANALALSSLTGPNESRFMAGRASFGLPLWSKLPPDLRRTLIGDLIVGWSGMDQARRADLDTLLTAESDQTREEIRSSLLVAGAAGAAISDALELSPEPSSDPESSTDSVQGTKLSPNMAPSSSP